MIKELMFMIIWLGWSEQKFHFAPEILDFGAPTVYGYLKRNKLVGTQLLSN